MEQRNIVDREGQWYVNTGEFSFTDPTTGVTFAPRVPTQVKQTAWMKSQPVIQSWVDPSEKPAAKK